MDALVEHFLSSSAREFTRSDAARLLDIVEEPSEDRLVNNLKKLLQDRFLFDLKYDGPFLLIPEIRARSGTTASYIEWRDFMAKEQTVTAVVNSPFSRYRKGNFMIHCGRWRTLRRFLSLDPAVPRFERHTDWIVDICEGILCHVQSLHAIYRDFERALRTYAIVDEYCARRHISLSALCKHIFRDKLAVIARRQSDDYIVGEIQSYLKVAPPLEPIPFIFGTRPTLESCLKHAWRLAEARECRACFMFLRAHFDIVAKRTSLARLVILPLHIPSLTPAEQLFIRTLKLLIAEQ